MESECFEDNEGNLVFERTTVVESNSKLRVSNSEQHYVTDDVVLFDLSEDEKEEIIQYVQEQKASATDSRSSGGNSYKYNWDTSGACKAYLRVYYTVNDSSGSEYYDLTKVTGGFSGASGTSNSTWTVTVKNNIVENGVTLNSEE